MECKAALSKKSGSGPTEMAEFEDASGSNGGGRAALALLGSAVATTAGAGIAMPTTAEEYM
jgi:hypothetical protein